VNDREHSHLLGVRHGALDALLDPLASRNVPTYVFSSGYGDIVTQLLLKHQQQQIKSHGGATAAQQRFDYSAFGLGSSSAHGLPNSLRVVSNFARPGPDGFIKGFTFPIVHERNKNATTISRLLNMPLPQRPHALVLGSHEDDPISMTDGLSGLTEKLSIGFLEVNEDLSSRLPVLQ
jgi:hypothetical protein